MQYKWIALSNTTMAVFMSALDGSIVIIALPAIFRGINLDPLAAGNISYLLWMIMGYRLVQAVLVVTVGRLGDMYGRVKIYNSGFAVFTAASILLSFDPFTGAHGAQWLIGWRVVQALGGSMLTANSAAILTDAFPADQRGLALGINQVAAIAGQFIGLVAGGDTRRDRLARDLLGQRAGRRVRHRLGVPQAPRDERAPPRPHRLVGQHHVRGRIERDPDRRDQRHQAVRRSRDGLDQPGGDRLDRRRLGLLVAFVVIEKRVAEPMFQLGLFKIRAFAAGSVAGLIAAVARGGLQFMLIIWLQGIWLPLHGYSYTETPLWAGIYLLPLTAAFLISGPICGYLSDRFGARGFATAGMLVFAASFVGLMLLPVDFPYWAFAGLITLNGIGVGMFSAPNSASIMSSVPARQRGAASGMRSTFQNTGTALSIGVFFSLLIAGLATSLPGQLLAGLQEQGVSHAIAHQVASLPPVSSLFAAVLGENPVAHLLGPTGALTSVSPAQHHVLTGTEFFPKLIASAFHNGLVVVFSVAAGLSVLAAAASLMRGGRYVHTETPEPTKGTPDDRLPPSDRPPPRGAARDGLPERGRRHARRT